MTILRSVTARAILRDFHGAGRLSRCAVVLLLLGLAVVATAEFSPQAHAALHTDAAQPDHACAVTLAIQGYCDTAAVLPTISWDRSSFERLQPAANEHRWTTPDFWHVPANAPPQKSIAS